MRLEDNNKQEKHVSDDVEMSFLEHLEELRWRIIYALGGLIVGTIISWIFIDFLIESILLLPAKQAELKLQNLRPFYNDVPVQYVCLRINRTGILQGCFKSEFRAQSL